MFGAGTPVDSFPAARREPAFRLLFNKPADRAYWLWMDRDPPLGEAGVDMEVGREDAGTEGQKGQEERKGAVRVTQASSFLVDFI